ncbi:MAG: 9-O-acetylesterase, partial [Candidatus Brocadiae bacterium]|nr:9-O-acetylesterase [Candidatus Brocadiia bacterium]
MRFKPSILSLSILLAVASCTVGAAAGTLEMHGIFSSNMVIQRDKPIAIWGWAAPGHKVSVQFGREKAEATAGGEAGRWEVTFPARQANATGQKMTVTSGDETLEMDN